MMKINNKFKNIIGVILVMLIVLALGNQVYAVEEKTTKKGTQTTTSVNKNAPKLDNLGIKPNDFTGFKSDIRDYTVKVPNDIEKVEVYANPLPGVTVTGGTGNVELKEGYNKVIVKLKGNNGEEGDYVLRIIREESNSEKIEKEENKTEENKQEKNEVEENKSNEMSENIDGEKTYEGLISLNIVGVELSPEFNTNVYEYKAEYTGEENKVDVKADVTNPHYSMEVMGNENLKLGNNTITIIVSDPDEKNVATYQIILNKKEAEEVQANLEISNQNKIYIALGFIIIVIAIIAIIKIKNRNKENDIEVDEYNEPFKNISYYDENLEKDEYNNDTEKEKNKKDYLENYNNEEEQVQKRRGKYQGKRFK